MENEASMQERLEDLGSILPFLPVVLRSPSLFWPSPAVGTLKAMSRGPDHSHVDSGEVLSLAISDLRNSLSLSAHPLASSVAYGYALFFDDLISREDAKRWFGEVVPAMADLLLRLPSLLESHYQNADSIFGGVKTGLRILDSQQVGIVFISQELIGALLACSFFCLLPSANRGARHLPTINFDKLFASIYDSYEECQENKIKCIVHYFERICSSMPTGYVSFERKVLPLNHSSLGISYPKAEFWSKSTASLCHFKVCRSGFLEDQDSEAIEVDFANKYVGGGALWHGCVQLGDSEGQPLDLWIGNVNRRASSHDKLGNKILIILKELSLSHEQSGRCMASLLFYHSLKEEIRFMINPELIASMLFLPAMADNEAIEIVGVERFSNYIGYASSFRFSGNHMDNMGLDSLGRRKTIIVAMDALCRPRMRQFRLECLIREINKAFCGFLDQSKHEHHQQAFEMDRFCRTYQDVEGPHDVSKDYFLLHEASSASETKERISVNQLIRTSETNSHYVAHQDCIGIATGNWGCGAFGGDPELKAVIQWLAASQASRPFILYFTFGIEPLETLDQVSQWILSHEWTVGELWDMLVKYSSKRLHGETNLGFFPWLLPSLSADAAERLDIPKPTRLGC